MKKKVISLLPLLIIGKVFASSTGLYLGGGLGYGMQNLSSMGNSSVQTSAAVRAFIGYQIFSFLDAEAGYTYISDGSNWNNLGSPSATIYDLSVEPGIGIPLTPITFFGRVGVDAISANLNTGWSNQLLNNMNGSFEWGGGIKLDIPLTNVFIRAEYINFGGVTNNNNSSVNVTPSVVMVDAAYVF